MQTISPASLVAIMVAARKLGDRDLERSAKQLLESEHGVRVSFAMGPKCDLSKDPKREGLSNAR